MRLNSDFNYVRNSVKAVVDAYDGTVTFYVVDTNDPIVKAYRGGVPGPVHQLSKMPAALKAHLRYPEDLFKLQSNVFSTYHVTTPEALLQRQRALVPLARPERGRGHRHDR